MNFIPQSSATQRRTHGKSDAEASGHNKVVSAVTSGGFSVSGPETVDQVDKLVVEGLGRKQAGGVEVTVIEVEDDPRGGDTKDEFRETKK